MEQGSMRLLAIDPGLHLLSFAVYNNGFMVQCGASLGRVAYLGAVALDHARSVADLIRPWGPLDVVAVEQMVYQPGRTANTKGANDLLDLQAIGGVVAGLLLPNEILYQTPKQWKGDRPKEVQHRRDMRDYTEREQEVLAEGLRPFHPKVHHNILDAAGIGLSVCKRRGYRP